MGIEQNTKDCFSHDLNSNIPKCELLEPSLDENLVVTKDDPHFAYSLVAIILGYLARVLFHLALIFKGKTFFLNHEFLISCSEKGRC